MKCVIRKAILCIVSVFVLFGLYSHKPAGFITFAAKHVAPEHTATLSSGEPVGKLPSPTTMFEENRGQAAPSIKFFSLSNNKDISFMQNEVLFRAPSAGHSKRKEPLALRMKFVGANAAAEIKGEDEMITKVNYYVGNDPAKWLSDVPNYNRVRYEKIYDGIDAVFSMANEDLEYDFHVEPGKSSQSILIRFEGARKVKIDRDGDLILKVGSNEMRHRRPIAYQLVNGEKLDVSVAFVLVSKNTVGFKVGDYDQNHELVIDPIVYSTYLGGSHDDYSQGVAVDSAGNIYVGSYTSSADFLNSSFPPSVTANKAVVTKLDPTGTSVIYNTFLGGATGHSVVWAIDVDSAGNAFIGGWTAAPDFPLLNARQSTCNCIPNQFEGYITKLNANGHLGGNAYSTYHGSLNDPTDYVQDLKVDSAGNAYAVGSTKGSNFPVTQNAFQSTINPDGASDAFFSKLSSGGTLLYSTFFGGATDDHANDIYVDGQGIAHIAGLGVNIPLINPHLTTGSGFVAKFNTNLSGNSSLIYSTKLRGPAYSVATDPTGNMYLNYLFQGNFYIIKLNALGSASLWDSLIGSLLSVYVDSIAVDSAGNAYFATQLDRTAVDNDKGVIVWKIAPNGARLGFERWNGSRSDLPTAIRHKNGSVYVVGYTRSTNFHVTSHAIQRQYRSTTASNQGFLARLIVGNDQEDAGIVPCQNQVGMPVNVANGNMFLQQTDYTLPSLGESINVTRTYNSIIQTAGLFGIGWTSQYDESLFVIDANTLQLQMPDGKAVYFSKDQTDTYVAVSAGFYGKIVVDANQNYILTFGNGAFHTFNSQGRLENMTDRNDNQVTLNYDINGKLTSIVDSYGRTLTVTPDGQGRISTLTDAIGVAANYVYDASDRLQEVNRPDGSKLTFTYEVQIDDRGTRNLLTEVRDATNKIIEKHEYYSNGRAKTSERQDGKEKYTFDYTHADDVTTPYTQSTDALGRVSKFFITHLGGRRMITKTEGVCSCGGSGSEITTYEYDNSLNLVKKVDALGQQTILNYDTSNTDPVRWGDLLSETDIYGTQKYTYNALGQVLTYKDRMDSLDPDPQITTYSYTYDVAGNLLTVKDRLNFVTEFAYPSTNNRGLPDSIKDARNHLTKFEWHPASGLLKEAEDAYGKISTYTYDSRGRIKTVTNPLGHVTQYNYFDDSQRKIETVYPNLDKVTYVFDERHLPKNMIDERGKITNYLYDDYYRLVKITDPLGHEKQFGYDDMSNRTSYSDPVGNVTDYLFDDFDRIKQVTYPAAASGGPRLSESFIYDKLGRIKDHTDTAGRHTLFDYTFNSATSIGTNTVTNTVNGQSEITRSKYNSRFQTVEVIDAINQTYSFTYDPLGRQLSRSRGGSMMTFVYDAVGNRIGRTDHNGAVTEYAYDDLNLMTEITYNGSSEFAAYSYDDLSRMVVAENQNGRVEFAYDNRNRLTGEIDVFNHKLEYTYDQAGRRMEMQIDGNTHAAYDYDDANRLTKLTDEEYGEFRFSYDNADRLISKTFPNGITSTYLYDGMSRLKRLTHDSLSALLDDQYAYNTANQISQIAGLSQTKNFSYDNVNRLTGMSDGTTTESYSFDAVGNRTASHLVANYTYDPFNILASTATFEWRYDENGSLVFGVPKVGPMDPRPVGTNYVWDREGRLLSAAPQNATGVSYAYDALGRRISRTDTGTTNFTYDGLDVVMDDDTTLGITTYQNGPGIDNKLKVTDGQQSQYFLQDHLGSTTALTDAGGDFTDTNSYDSFGNPSNTKFLSRYQFTGREWDSVSNLQFSRARWYDPSVGRFISEDPIGLTGGINQYTYVGNNPVNGTDPLGLYIEAIFYRTKGKLVVTDYGKDWFWGTDKSTQYVFEGVFSGDGPCRNTKICDASKDEGPIPKGFYLIPNQEDVNSQVAWKRVSFRLYRSQNTLNPWQGPFEDDFTRVTDPFTGSTAMRGGFYLHPGTMSIGCITFPKDGTLPSGAPFSHEFERLRRVIKETSPYIYKDQKFAGRLIVQ